MEWATFWLMVFGLSAMMFFTIAAVAAVRGLFDLRDLLRTSKKK